MADNVISPFEDEKFNKIYRFVVLTTLLVFAYIFCICFIPIPSSATENIKTVLIFLLGYLSANGNYLTGGNPSTQKKPDNGTAINANADTTNVTVNTPPTT